MEATQQPVAKIEPKPTTDPNPAVVLGTVFNKAARPAQETQKTATLVSTVGHTEDFHM